MRSLAQYRIFVADDDEKIMKPLDTLPARSRRIEDSDLRQLFQHARTHNCWLDKPVPDTMLREIYDLVKFGPTSMNTQPLRLLFLRTAAAKERLRPHLAPANVDKAMAAPVTDVRGQTAVDREDGLPQRQPPGWLSHYRGTCSRAGLRADVRIR